MSLLRPVVDRENFAQSALNYNKWLMCEKMWLLASLEALAANSLSRNARRILIYYREVAEQHYLRKISDLMDEQARVIMNEEE